MYYQGPVNNPGVEVNVMFGGRLMCDGAGSVEDTLADVLETLYRPKSAAALKKLVALFQRAEDSYFEQWGENLLQEARQTPPPGEVHVCELIGIPPAPATYLQEPWLSTDGRVAYKEGLSACVKDVQEMEVTFDDG